MDLPSGAAAPSASRRLQPEFVGLSLKSLQDAQRFY